jgi:hypothetical protein
MHYLGLLSPEAAGNPASTALFLIRAGPEVSLGRNPAVVAPGKELIMRYPLVRAVALVFLLAVVATPLAFAAGERLPRTQPAGPSFVGQVWNLVRSVFAFLGHEVDPNGLQSSDPDRGHGIDPDG